MSGEHDRYPSLRITGLGNFAIEYLAAHATAADNALEYSSVAEHLWRGRKQAQTVLKALLCRPHRRASREVLQEAIWPHGKGDSAETAFNAIISVLRHVLNLPITQKPLLTITRVDEQTIYQLAPQTLIWMDADEAEALLKQAEQARRDNEDPLPFLEQAYRFFGQGPFLAEDDGAWVQQHKWHMDEAAHRCTHWLVDLYEERDLPRQATTILSALYRGDPQQALLLLEHAQELVTQDTADIILSWLYAITGETFAYLRDIGACFKVLDKAEAIFERGHSGKITYSFATETAFAVFSASKLLSYKGASLIRLKQLQAAQQVLTKALVSTAPTDIHLKSITFVDLGITFVQKAEIKEAYECASQALSLIEKTRSARVYQRVLSLRHALEPWKHMVFIKNLDEHLMTVKPSIAM